MKKLTALLIFTLLSSISFTQQRISFDLSSRFQNLQGTFSYHRVFKTKFIVSAGLTVGSHDKLYRDYYTENESLQSFRTPFNSLNQDLHFSDTTFQLAQYTNKTSLMGINLSLGFFHEFSVVHGVRTHVNFFTGLGFNAFSLNYYEESRDLKYRKNSYERITTSAIELQLYHTIRINPRMTFYYGAKIPYYIDVDNSFSPSTLKDSFIGFEPQLTLGLSRAIGKCD